MNNSLEDITSDRRMTCCSYAVLFHLVAIADEDGVAVATLDQIAEHVKYERAGTARAIQSLVSQGRLLKERRGQYRIPEAVCMPKSITARQLAAIVEQSILERQAMAS